MKKSRFLATITLVCINMVTLNMFAQVTDRNEDGKKEEMTPFEKVFWEDVRQSHEEREAQEKKEAQMKVLPKERGYETITFQEQGKTGWFLVEKEGKKGVCDIEWNEIIALDYYDDIKATKTEVSGINDFYFIVAKDGMKSVIDKNGKEIIAPCYSNVSVRLVCNDFYFWVGKGDKKGVFDKNGKEIIGPCYSNVYVLPVGNVCNGFYFGVETDNKRGTFDINGKEIITPCYSEITVRDTDDDFYFIVFSNNNKAVCNKNGEIIVSPNYYEGVDVIDVFGTHDTLYYVFDKDDKIGVCDNHGRLIFEPKYDDLSFDGLDGLCHVEINSKKGLYDKEGRELIAPQYDEIYHVYDKNLSIRDCYYIKLKGRIGVCDRNGQEIIAPKYDELRYDEYGKGYSIVVLNGKMGVCDKYGKEIIEPKYDRVFRFGDYYYVKTNGKEGVCDEGGNVIIDLKYDFVMPAASLKYYMVEVNGRKGVCAKNGEEILEPKYDELMCTQNDVFLYKDGSGNWLSTGITINGDPDPDFVYNKYFDEGSNCFTAKKYRKAAKSYKKALEYKETPEAYYNVALSYYNLDKYDDAITYSRYCLNNNPRETLKNKAQNLINESRRLIAQKKERRQAVAMAFIGGALAFTTGVVYTSLGANSTSFNTNSGNLDYLLDPNYAIWQAQQQQAEFDAINRQLINLSIWQTEQQEYETYLLMTSGGTTMTFDEWKALAAQAAMNESFNTDMNSFISDAPREMEYKGNLSPDQYQAAYRFYESSAQDYYRYLTMDGVREQDKNGNIQGKTIGQIPGGNYTTWKQGLSKAQTEMRRIRQEAAQYGVTIQQSQWETASASY